PLSSSARPRPAARRPGLEILEDRLTPTSPGGVVDGVFTNPNHSPVAGVSLTLSGTMTSPTSLGTQVNMTISTNQFGHYEFDNVRPGTYQLSYQGVPTLLGFGGSNHPGTNVISASIVITGGEHITKNVPFGFVAPTQIPNNLLLPPFGSGSLTPPAGTGF